MLFSTRRTVSDGFGWMADGEEPPHAERRCVFLLIRKRVGSERGRGIIADAGSARTAAWG